MPIYHDSTQGTHEKPDGEPIHWRVSAYGIVENAAGEILMVEPAWTKRLDLPGGGVHVEEQILDGLKREFYEETGYRVTVDNVPFSIFESDFFHSITKTFEHVIGFTYRARLDGESRDAHVVNTFEDGFEIRDMCWVNPAMLKEGDVQPCHWKAIQEFVRLQKVAGRM